MKTAAANVQRSENGAWHLEEQHESEISGEPGAAGRTATQRVNASFPPTPDASLPSSREPGASLSLTRRQMRKRKDVAPQEERRRVLAALLSSKKHIMLPDWLILTQRGRRLKVDSVLCACEPGETPVSYKPPPP